MPRVLLLFVDGVGLGDDDVESNPVLSARLPVLSELLGARLPIRANAAHHAHDASLMAIDATLGIPGTPQSGTGQAALLTGANAAAMHGRHFGPWVPARLQRMVREESVLASALALGHRVAFANAYPEEVLDLARAAAGTPPRMEQDGVDMPAPAPLRRAPIRGGTTAAGTAEARADRRRRRAPVFLRAGPPLAALGAGVLTRHTQALERGDAVASEITNDGWRDVLGRTQLPIIDAERAGTNLAGIVAANDLTLFAHYATDHSGHRRSMTAAVAALERLDSFIGGLLGSLPGDALVFMVSDHGNIEDIRTGHTRNPAIGLVAGRGHPLLSRRLRSLTDVAPTIIDALAL